MPNYENCQSCNTTLDLDQRDRWTSCAHCESAFCRDCISGNCPVCKKPVERVYDSGIFHVSDWKKADGGEGNKL